MQQKIILTLEIVFSGLCLLASAAGCGQLDAQDEMVVSGLRLVPRLTMFDEGEVHFEFGVLNESGSRISRMEDANIEITVTDQGGEIRNQMWIAELPALAPGESVYPLTIDAVFVPGEYEVQMTGKDMSDHLTFRFEIIEQDDGVVLAAHPDLIDPHTEFTVSDPKN
jgi:hypothetical protein